MNINPINFDKRTTLKVVMLSTLGHPIAVISKTEQVLPAAKLHTLTSYLDYLIPRDQSPSASDLNIHIKLVEHSRNIENYPILLNLGPDWLNNQSVLSFGSSFTRLSDSQKEKIILLAKSAKINTIPYQLYHRIRNDAMLLYYSDRRSWIGLGISMPPQPVGYMDYFLRKI